MKKLLIAFSLISYHSSLISQNVAINNTGATANPSAILDISDTTKGVLISRMTTGQMNRIASPALGLMVFNITTNCLMVYSGNTWQSIYCACISAPGTPGSISGASAVCADTTGKIYSIAAVFGANSYTWNVPTGATITAGQGTPSITVSFGSVAGNITVTATNSCGTSAASTLPVTINTIPTSVTATASPNPVCAGNTLTLTGGATGATGWSWMGPNSFSSASQNPAITNITASGAGTYSLTASNVCGSATPANTASVAVHTIQYVPVTLTNNQSSTTGTNFQQMLTVNSSTYTSNESSGLQNVEFTTGPGATGTVLQAWIESGAGNTSGNTIYWVNLGSATIAGNGGTLTIYMNFMPSNIMSSSGPTGEAPQLSGNYGQYDNGANVFGFYDKFAGTSVNSSAYNEVIPSGTSVTQNNGITISTNQNSTYGGLISINGFQGTPAQIFDGDVTSVGGVAAGLALQTGNTGSSTSIDFNYWGGSVGTGTMNPPGMDGNNNPNLQISTGIMGGAWVSSSSQVWYENYTATPGSLTTYSLPGTIYPSFGIYYSSSSSYISFQWIRTHLYPPNGVMPGVSFGSETCQ